MRSKPLKKKGIKPPREEFTAQKKRVSEAASAELEAKRQIMYDDRADLMAYMESAEWLHPYYTKPAKVSRFYLACRFTAS